VARPAPACFADNGDKYVDVAHKIITRIGAGALLFLSGLNLEKTHERITLPWQHAISQKAGQVGRAAVILCANACSAHEQTGAVKCGQKAVDILQDGWLLIWIGVTFARCVIPIVH
jgi:hypothetical protein